MAQKRRKPNSDSAKRIKLTPLSLDDAWGFVAQDVVQALDWPELTGGLDSLKAQRSWALGLTHSALQERLPFQLAAAAVGQRVRLLPALRGKAEPAETAAGLLRFIQAEGISLEAVPGKGRGWLAKRALPAGTVLLVERPMVSLLDMEWQGQAWAECDSADTTALGLQLARCCSSSLQAALEGFHPQGETRAESCSDSEQDALKDALEAGWASVDLDASAKTRLQAVVRLNSLGFYSMSEQICHTGNYTALTGSGLFALGSGFNHSCAPCVSRYSIGDVTVFVANGHVEPDTELCISYIENEFLCAPVSMRRQMLNRDFVCTCVKCDSEGVDIATDSAPRYLSVDSQVQAQLSILPPAERVEAAEAALRCELGRDGEDENGESEEDADSKAQSTTVLFGKDAQELRVVLALAFMQLKKYDQALAVWRSLAAFSCHHCPPWDESLAVYATQAALCEFARKRKEAKTYLAIALSAHRIAFGSQTLFKWRFQKEVELSFVDDIAKRLFWTIVDDLSDIEFPVWTDFIASWHFESNEIPPAEERAPAKG